MLRDGSREQGWNGIANLPDLLLKVAGEYKRIIKTLEPSGFANGYAAMISIMDKTPRAGIGKIGCDCLSDAVTMQATVGLAQVFDFPASVKPAASVQILIAATFGNFFQFLFDKFLIMLAGEMIGQSPRTFAT